MHQVALSFLRSAASLLISSTAVSTSFRIAHIQRSDGWIKATWNNMSDPAAFAAAGAEEQEGGEPPPLGRRWNCGLPDGVRAKVWGRLCLGSQFSVSQKLDAGLLISLVAFVQMI